MKRILVAIVSTLTMMSVWSQTYNMVETSYVTTTIAQTVVFNDAMRAGGTFNFSVQAHNGGGNAGTNDTANVKILFYNASNGLVGTAATAYSRNLLIPTGIHGVDPNVPWSTLSISSTNCQSSCSSVAYAVVQMVGIDGSYWAGDYGPYYQQPSLTFNGGRNILYNPEFGSAPNGTLVQGWSATPNWGVCQGAYGGSNPCTTNYSGVTANASNGGYSATGGTTSSTPGGYTAAPTVTSTTTTNSTQTTIIGKNQVVTTTPTTTTTYSDGTSTTTTGSSTTSTASSSAFTGVHFGAAQVADTQWNVQACTQTNRCQVYSTQPGGTYNTGSWTPISSTQYITFIPNTGSDSATNPWKMILVNSDGTFTSMGTGRILVQGVDSNNNIYMFFTNDNYNGTLLSANLGLTGQGADFTGVANPTVGDTESLATGMSSTPLAAGQTGGSGGGTSWPATSEITVIETGVRSAAVGRVGSVGLGNSVYIDERSGSSNNRVTVEQTGFYNRIGGLGGNDYAILNGSSNDIAIKQGDGLGHNLTEFSVVGNTNTVTVWQARSVSTGGQTGHESGGHYSGISVLGNSNTVVVRQANDGGSGSGHFAYVDVTGNNNSGSIQQSGDGTKTFFGVVNGAGNVFGVTQQGSGSFADVSLTGSGNGATITQQGSGSHKATVNLTNSGGSGTVTLVQQGSTAQNINITQSCATLGGCSVNVTQGQ